MFKSLFIEGRIPYLMALRRIIFWIAILAPFSIFWLYTDFRTYAKIAWYMLICVMMIRPLADIFPEIKIFRSLVLLRREFGVFSALLIVAHFTGFLLVNHINIFDWIFNKKNWDLNSFLTWGMLGLFFALFPLLTSNKFSMLVLKNWWKKIQKFSYLFFFFGGIHVVLIGRDFGPGGLIMVLVAWLLAQMKIQIRFQGTNGNDSMIP